MKKLLALLLVLSLLAVCSGCLAEAESPAADAPLPEWEIGMLDDGTAEILRYNGTQANPAVPAEIDGVRITAVGNSAFAGCDFLTDVTLPEGIVRIGDRAFEECAALAGITVPISVTDVGMNPFARCASLKDIRLAQDHPALELRNGVLYGKQDARLISYPCASEEIDFVIPDGVRVIGGMAFFRCENLITVTIPASVTRIDPYAFCECTALSGIVIPDGVTEIPDRAFSVCVSLNTAVLPPSVTRIGNWAFFACLTLADISIPENVTEIGYYAFSHCAGLTNVRIPEKTEKIGACAFSYCENLLEINLPASISFIGFEAFDHCYHENRSDPDLSTKVLITVAAGSYAEEYCRSDKQLSYESR